MKKIASRSCLTLILLSLLLSSCGETQPDPKETTASDSSVETTAEEGYKYPELDYGGKTFTILNTDNTYGFYDDLDFEEQSGEAVDDAIYNRNRTIEDKFKLKLEVIDDYLFGDAISALQTSVMSNEHLYDVAFVYNANSGSLFTNNYLIDMQDLKGFNFDEPWWDKNGIDSLRIGSKQKILFAYTDISLTDFQGTLVTFFNEKIMNDLKLELPYDIVREGKWTYDKMGEYMKAGANLNGDESFTFSADGKATYGLASWDQGEVGMVFGSGYGFIGIEDKLPVITAGDEKFINAAQKLITLLSPDGEYLSANGGEGGHYETIFKAGRSLLAVCELKATNKYRDMSDSYGILPMAKVDETQENYYCLRNFSYLMCIPSTNPNPDDAAVIMDAMGYLTYRDVMTPFYEGRVSQKSLRDEESIEMLEIIRNNRTLDVGRCFGWYDNYCSIISGGVKNKSTDIVSKIAALKSPIEQDIAKKVENIES